jgi:carboxyl-terminal processing protease
MEFEPGDILLQIDDIDVSSIPTMEEAHQTARQALLGDIGSTVKLKIYSRAEQKVVELTTERAQIISKASRVRMEGDVMVIRISTFNQNTYPQMKEGVEDMLNKRGDTIIGTVIDLRGNPGGLLEQAAASSDAFLEGGVITTIKWPNGREEEHSAKAGDMLNGLPITVLINEKSASGAEIMAGALQENKRALVMGIRSLGKGSVQTISYLPNNGGMKMTTALYYTPSGRSINHLGITPDIWIEDTPAISLPRNESAFYDRLISKSTTEDVRQTLEQEKKVFLRKQQLRAQDPQMAAALDSIVSRQND